MVGMDARVILIDCDSYQLRDSTGRVFRCEVGVPEFTPPELQAISSFALEDRTPNHDTFGLALMIFLLLFGGRHPYSGKPLVKHAGEDFPSDIRAFRYAYASDAHVRGMSPPPHSIPLTLVPRPIAELFEQAFTERGATLGRPTAAQWLAALGNLRGMLCHCPVSTLHVYPSVNSTCPWCDLERTSGILLFVGLSRSTGVDSVSFDLDTIWREISHIDEPKDIPSSARPSGRVHARPIPGAIRLLTTRYLVFMSVFVGIFWGLIVVPNAWLVTLIVGGLGLLISSKIGRNPILAEVNQRRNELLAARKFYEEVRRNAEDRAGPNRFRMRRVELAERKKLQTSFTPNARRLP